MMDPSPYLVLMDPNPEGPKTCGSWSATLLKALAWSIAAAGFIFHQGILPLRQRNIASCRRSRTVPYIISRWSQCCGSGLEPGSFGLSDTDLGRQIAHLCTKGEGGGGWALLPRLFFLEQPCHESGLLISERNQKLIKVFRVSDPDPH